MTGVQTCALPICPPQPRCYYVVKEGPQVQLVLHLHLDDLLELPFYITNVHYLLELPMEYAAKDDDINLGQRVSNLDRQR